MKSGGEARRCVPAISLRSGQACTTFRDGPQTIVPPVGGFPARSVSRCERPRISKIRAYLVANEGLGAPRSARGKVADSRGLVRGCADGGKFGILDFLLSSTALSGTVSLIAEGTMRWFGMAVVAFEFGIPTASIAHPGGLAADGCHNDRKRGGRHCHGGSSSRPVPPQVQRFSSRRSAYYANCSEARAAGAAPVRRGDPDMQHTSTGITTELDANDRC